MKHAPGLEAPVVFEGTGRTVRVWDPVVRLFHWGVVGAVSLNLFILEPGKAAHRYSGYVAMSLLAVRVVWGFIGKGHATFADFFPTARSIHGYSAALLKGREPRMLGHNPLAAVMMIALMALLALVGGTGYATTLDMFWGMKWLENLHAILANTLMVLAGLHAAAAVAESVRHRENLVWAMVTGRKRPLR